jgi:hypothetical protein
MLRIFKKRIILSILITVVSINCSYAATITVTNLNDTGAGSLRQAISTANLDVAQDEIVFTASLTGTITLASNLPTINNSLIITGLGVDQLTISGAGLYTMFSVINGKVLTISKLNFTNNPVFNGGVFKADSGGSSIVASYIKVIAVTNNFAFLALDGAIIKVSNSIFSSNSGILFFSNYGTTPQNTSNNDADYTTRITVENSTFSNNTGMIFQTERYVKIVGCNFVNNTGGIGNFRGLNRYQVLNSTFTSNGSILFQFASAISSGVYLSTLGTNHHLFTGNTFSNNTGTIIDTGTANEQSKTTISNNTFTNNGANWTGNPAVISNNTIQSAATLNNFNDITKIYFDGSYTISPPNTNSSGAFTYTSSNTAVATISGAVVTIIGAGLSTITATQAADATYSQSSINSQLTVNTVQVVNTNGESSNTKVNYVNDNGAIGGNIGVDSNGKLKTTRSLNTAGLVLWLDADNTSSYSGTGNTWFDLSGNNNHISWSAPAPQFTTDNGIKVIKTTDATGALRAMVSSNYNNLPTGNQPYTAISFFKPNSTAAAKMLLSLGPANNLCAQIHPIAINYLGKYSGGACGGLGTWSRNTGISPSTSSYVCVATTYNSSTEKVYVNGNLDKTATMTTNIPVSAVKKISIGWIADGGANYNMDANIGIILFYNRELSASEITHIYNTYRLRFGLN